MRTMKMLCLTVAMVIGALTASAQPLQNRALPANEQLQYKLYFNWKFIWVSAGTAKMSTTETTYKGKPAFKCYLSTATSKKVDKYFRMRDTLLVYASKQLMPLYYRKASHEGKRNYFDEITYSHQNGTCRVSHHSVKASGAVKNESHTYDHTVYDMLNVFLRARNFDATNWKKGHTVNIDIAGFSDIVKAKLVYRGKTSVKAEDGNKHNCLELSYIEREDNKDHEVCRFFVTDDVRHIPVRIDLNLKFGTAKAFINTVP